MVEYIQSNDDSGNMALYAGIAATAAVGGAALAYRMSDPAYKDKERTKGKIAAGEGKNQGVDINNIRKQEVNNMMKKLAPDATSKVGGLKSLANAVIGMGPLTARGREGLEGMVQRGIEKNYEPSMASTQRGYDNRAVDGGKMRDLLYETHSKSALSAYGGKEYTPVTAERLLDEMHKQNPDSLLTEPDARKMVNRVEKDRLKMDSFMDTIHDKGYDVDEAFKMFSKENPALANSGEGTRTMFNNEWDMRKGNQGEMGKLIHDKEMAHRAALNYRNNELGKVEAHGAAIDMNRQLYSDPSKARDMAIDENRRRQIAAYEGKSYNPLSPSPDINSSAFGKNQMSQGAYRNMLKDAKQMNADFDAQKRAGIEKKNNERKETQLEQEKKNRERRRNNAGNVLAAKNVRKTILKNREERMENRGMPEADREYNRQLYEKHIAERKGRMTSNPGNVKFKGSGLNGGSRVGNSSIAQLIKLARAGR